MPGAHRDTDDRYCGGKTIVVGQNNVFVNNLLWAVKNDPEDHGHGELIPVYGWKNVYINNKLVICAIGDKAYPDDAFHPAPPTDPYEHSDNVFVYDGIGNSAEPTALELDNGDYVYSENDIDMAQEEIVYV